MVNAMSRMSKMSGGTNTPTGPGTVTFQRRWYVLAVLCLSLLIVTVGNASLNVTLPTLSRDLGATETQLQWVVAIYSLVFAGLLFTTGAIGDRFGRKGALQLGLLIVLVAVIVASTSSQMWELIMCRAAMGLGAALIMPSTLSILINVFPPHERTKAIAIWASVTGAGGAVGQLISGALLAHFWWGSVFLINVPLVLTALVGGFFLLPKSRDPEESPLDPGGAVLSTIGVVALVFAVIEAPEHGWLDSRTLIAFAVSAVFLLAFVLYEKRVEDPMVDMAYFRNRAFSTATGSMVLVFLAMYGMFFLITQYLQLVQGYSAFGAAFRLLPTALLMIIVAPQTPRISAKLGANRAVSLGMFFAAGGMFSFFFLGKTTSWLQMVSGFSLFSIGISMTMSPMTAAIMSAVPPRRAGAGSAMNDATRELGAALGVAVLGSITATHYSHAVAPAVDAALTGSAASSAKTALANALEQANKLPAAAGQALTKAADNAFLGGLHIAVLVGAALALTSSVVVLRYLPQQLRHRVAAPSSVTEELEPAI
ncbi:MAG: drug resistance transporter, EmrB/QacA subfamily [Ilumatobacteraceae bacterium]|nr:drug resistance transporter, EmrB/QacA subfamily [Ilumatobacteraceae bacterium]